MVYKTCLYPVENQWVNSVGYTIKKNSFNLQFDSIDALQENTTRAKFSGLFKGKDLLVNLYEH